MFGLCFEQIGVEYLSANAMVKIKNTQTVLLKAIRTVKQPNLCYRLELFLQRGAGWKEMAGGIFCEEQCPTQDLTAIYHSTV